MACRLRLSILPAAWLVLSVNVLAAGQNATADAVVGWVAGPSERGTLNLVWSCVITIFACTWTVLHLNVPGLHEGPWRRGLRKAKWMAINVLFPEFILSKAVCDLRQALYDLCEFDEKMSVSPRILWTMESVHGLAHQWSWEIGYPRGATLLYRLLWLEVPEMDREPEDRTATETGTRVVLANRPADDVGEAAESGRFDTRSRAHASQIASSRNSSVCSQSAPRRDTTCSEKSEEAFRIQWQTTQRWTLAHSYYAQMGGLIYVGPSSDRGEPAYYVARPSSLIWRFMWTPDHHPLYYLVLSEQDIQDRSKADWLVKSIALMQITWLVLNVAVRRSTGLPVTQLEIATLSFAVMAIITYLANWWKPKDVSQPTILPAVYETLAFSIHEGAFDRTQPFTRRLWSPAQAAMDAASIPDLERVPNDVVWMEGATPLMLVLMAISSLVFGGLHCLAWSFEFPTPAERICWRVASLVSAILPVATLGASAVLNHLSTTSAESRILSTFLTKLRPLKQLPLEWWEKMEFPAFGNWGDDARTALACVPRSQRDWEKKPPEEAIEAAKAGSNWAASKTTMLHVQCWTRIFSDFRELWEDATMGDSTEHPTLREDWLHVAHSLLETVSGRDDVRQFIHDYEAFLRRKLAVPATVLPDTTCLDHILQAYRETQTVCDRVKEMQKAYTRASTLLTIGSGILYTAARLAILVLVFTSLRRVPAGVYQDTPWTRFLPTFS